MMRPFWIAAVAFAVTVVCSPIAEGVERNRPEMPGVDNVFTKPAIIEAMRRVHAYQQAHPYTPTDRNWIRGTYYTGVMALYKTTRDPKILDQAIRWADKHDWQPGTERAPANCKTCGQTYLELYFLERDPARIAKMRSYVDSRMAVIAGGQPPRKDWYYCDTLYVGPPTIAMLGKATGESKYYEYLNKVYWDVIDYLFDKEYGLVYRDASYFDARTKNGKRVFWSRGNGWVIGGIPRILSYLPKDNPRYEDYVRLLRTMATAIARRQGADGLWRSNLEDPEQFPNPETSGSAFFCYAMAWGINHRVLDRDQFLPVVLRAWEGLVRQVQPDGKLGFVQPVGAAPQPATRDMTHEYAMGLFLLAGSEMVPLVESGAIGSENRARIVPPAAAKGTVTQLSHPLHEAIHRFLRDQNSAAQSFQPTGLQRDDYLEVIAGQVRAIRQYQDKNGRIIDPVDRREREYTTPCYAHCVAALASSGHVTDTALVESGMRAMDVAVADMLAAKVADGHGDFFTWPVMLAYELYANVAPAPRLSAWRRQLAKLDPQKLYRVGQGGANWNVVNLAGEFLRAKNGFTDLDYVEACLASQLEHFTPLGMYSEHGNPLPYDHFPRHYLGGMLFRGYRGRSFQTYRDLLWRGAWTSLFMQSPFGELPTGYRSSHHIWNEAEQAVTFEIYARHYAIAGRSAEAGAFQRAAHLSLRCIQQWLRPDGSGYIVKNRYPIEARHGYESYSVHTCYNMLACSMLAQAWQYAGTNIAERPCPADVGGFVIPILRPFHKVFANAAGAYVEFDTAGDHVYNPTGLLRVHLRDGHPQLGPSDGCAPKFSGEGVNLAVGPEWKDENGWHRLASLRLPDPAVQILHQGLERVQFRVEFKCTPGVRAKLVPGQAGQAYDFSDPKSGMLFPTPVDLGHGDYTFCLWIKPANSDGKQGLLAGTIGGQHAVYLELDGDTVRFLHRVPPGRSGGTDVRVEMTRSLAGRWHHLAAVKRGTALQLFVDGALRGEDTVETSLPGPVRIGIANLNDDTMERHYGGAIDELRVYRRAISPEQIKNLSKNRADDASLQDDLVIYRPFDAVPDGRGVRLSETITLDRRGVTVRDQIEGDGISAMRVNYPLLVFDGKDHPIVRLAGSSVSVRLAGRGIRFQLEQPADVVLRRTGEVFAHRNGRVERVVAEFPGRSAVYRISAD